MNVIIIGVLIICGLSFIGSKMEGNDNSYEKTREWLIKSRDVFNDITLRFNKCGYPITDYLEALFNAYEKGLKPLNNTELNFYLSYPKKYEVIKNHLFVNNVDLGLASECVLFNEGITRKGISPVNIWDGSNYAHGKDFCYKNLLGEKFFIKNYIINENYTGIMGEIDARTGSEQNCKDRLYKEVKEDYKNLEKESKKYYDTFVKKYGISPECQDLINDLIVCHDLSECQEKINKFSESARNEYKEINKEYIDTFNADLSKNSSKVFNRHYNKGINHSRTTDICALSEQDAERMNLDKELVKDNVVNVRNLNILGCSNVNLEKKYANILVGVEKHYNIENEKVR